MVPALITALGDVDTEVRQIAAETLVRVGPAAVEAVPADIYTTGQAGAVGPGSYGGNWVMTR